jgi:hypothetical protein
MKHDPDHDHLRLGGNTHIRRVGLLLDEGEAHDVVKRYVTYKGHPGLSSGVIHQIFGTCWGYRWSYGGPVEVRSKFDICPLYGRVADKFCRNSTISIYGTGPH